MLTNKTVCFNLLKLQHLKIDSLKFIPEFVEEITLILNRNYKRTFLSSLCSHLCKFSKRFTLNIKAECELPIRCKYFIQLFYNNNIGLAHLNMVPKNVKYLEYEYINTHDETTTYLLLISKAKTLLL